MRQPNTAAGPYVANIFVSLLNILVRLESRTRVCRNGSLQVEYQAEKDKLLFYAAGST